jgi:hypothetical protein
MLYILKFVVVFLTGVEELPAVLTPVGGAGAAALASLIISICWILKLVVGAVVTGVEELPAVLSPAGGAGAAARAPVRLYHHRRHQIAFPGYLPR